MTHHQTFRIMIVLILALIALIIIRLHSAASLLPG